MQLDTAAAAAAVHDRIAAPLRLGVPDAALGIVHDRRRRHVAGGARRLGQPGHRSARQRAIIAFGGAGPLHAVAVAREISIPRVIVPKLPGNFSALGMLMASWRQDFVRTLFGLLGTLDKQRVETVFADLAEAGHRQLARDGIDRRRRFRLPADLRYAARSTRSPFRLRHPDLLGGDFAPLRLLFDAEHDQRYGQAAPDEPIEIVNVRLTVTARRPDTLAERWLSAPWVPEGAVAEPGAT